MTLKMASSCVLSRSLPSTYGVLYASRFSRPAALLESPFECHVATDGNPPKHGSRLCGTGRLTVSAARTDTALFIHRRASCGLV